MTVSSRHPDYEYSLPLWRKVRTAIQGEEAVKDAGIVYLPKLSGQHDSEYLDYKSRAMFYGASGRTVQGLTGAIFRKPPDIKFPEANKELLKTIGRHKEPIEDVAKEIVEACTGIGRVGVLVDAPRTENAKPFITLYAAESIINWLAADGPNGEEIVQVVLEEVVEVRDENDPFLTKKVTRYRVLSLGDPNSDELTQSEVDLGDIYFQDVFEEQTTKQNGKNVISLVYLGRIIPRKRGGQVWRKIPFQAVNSSSIRLKPEKSPILDLVNVNLSHYRNSADLEHGRHFTSLPTAWVTGFDPKTELTIGSARAWVSSEVNAKAGFLEFTGAGLGHLADGMKDKEKLMAILGARMLEELPVGTEAAETVRLRQSGEASALSSIALTCSTAITQALKDFADWMSIPSKDISVTLNRDFQTAGLAPNVLQNLILAVQGGLLSWSSFFYNLKRGELIPDHVEEKEELLLIKQGSSMFVVPNEPTNGSLQQDKRISTS